MTQTPIDLYAKRVGSDLHLYRRPETVPFARLVDCEVCHIFESEDPELEAAADHYMEADYSLREQLQAVRRMVEDLDRRHAEEAEADYQTELAVERFYEDAGWAEAELQRRMEDERGVIQFEDAMDQALGRTHRE